MRGLPRDHRHAGLWDGWAGPDSRSEPRYARSGDGAECAVVARALDRGPTGNQAGQPHAASQIDDRGAPRRLGLSRDAFMSERRDGPDFTGTALNERLAQTWSDPPGLWGWITTVDHKR